MSFWQRIRANWSRISARRSPDRARVWLRPRLEVLEDRCLLTYSLTDLDATIGGMGSYAYSINATGQVVGQAYRPFQ